MPISKQYEISLFASPPFAKDNFDWFSESSCCHLIFVHSLLCCSSEMTLRVKNGFEKMTKTEIDLKGKTQAQSVESSGKTEKKRIVTIIP